MVEVEEEVVDPTLVTAQLVATHFLVEAGAEVRLTRVEPREREESQNLVAMVERGAFQMVWLVQFLVVVEEEPEVVVVVPEQTAR